ncbi:MAG: DUF5666 domain-containing protein [Acidimicrobiales bacterium]
MQSNSFKNRLSGRLARFAIGGAVTIGIAAGSYGAASATTQAMPGPGGGPPARGVPPRPPAAKPPGVQAVPVKPAPGPPPGGLLTAIGSSSITVEGPNGKATTFATISSTAYAEGGHSISRSELHTGDPVRVLPKGSGSKSSGSSRPTASAVDVVRSHVSGIVDSVSNGTIMITDFQGFKRTIVTSSRTRYLKGTSTVSRSAVTDGEVVGALGTLASGGTELGAQLVAIGQPGPGGPGGLQPLHPPLLRPPSSIASKSSSSRGTSR